MDNPEGFTMTTDQIKRSPKAQGKAELLAFMAGKRLSYRKTLLAKCFECMNGYVDGKLDCRIGTCPNYSFMPYRQSQDTANQALQPS